MLLLLKTARMSLARPLQRPAVCLAALALLVIYLAARGGHCAPGANASGSNSKNEPTTAVNRLLRPGLLSNLFRRANGNHHHQNTKESATSGDQTSAASSESASSSAAPSSASGEADEAASQTELEAQKFMDSLPGAGGNSNSGPSSFRERVSESWGLLRDGVSNQFKSLRDNWSETVEDLRDTWTGSSD